LGSLSVPECLSQDSFCPISYVDFNHAASMHQPFRLTMLHMYSLDTIHRLIDGDGKLQDPMTKEMHHLDLLHMEYQVPLYTPQSYAASSLSLEKYGDYLFPQYFIDNEKNIVLDSIVVASLNNRVDNIKWLVEEYLFKKSRPWWDMFKILSNLRHTGSMLDLIRCYPGKYIDYTLWSNQPFFYSVIMPMMTNCQLTFENVEPDELLSICCAALKDERDTICNHLNIPELSQAIGASDEDTRYSLYHLASSSKNKQMAGLILSQLRRC